MEFSAPVFNEPAVTADLKGPAVKASPQIHALSAIARLLAAGDLAGARKLQTERAARRFDMGVKLTGADAAKLAKQGGADLKQMVPRINRMVVRGDRAVALAGKDQWVTLVREGDRWKVDL